MKKEHLKQKTEYKTKSGKIIKIDYCYNPGLKFPGICKGFDEKGAVHTWDENGVYLYKDRAQGSLTKSKTLNMDIELQNV